MLYFHDTSLKSSVSYLGWCVYISRARNRFTASLLLLTFVTRLSHNSDVTESSSHLAERFQPWLMPTAVWPASCLTIVGKQKETGSKHGRIHLLTQSGHRGQRQQGKGLGSRGRGVCLSWIVCHSVAGKEQRWCLQHQNSLKMPSWCFCPVLQFWLSLLCIICL